MYQFNFKILLLILIGCFVIESQACNISNRGNSNHLVVTIEGLGGRLLGSQAQRTATALNRSNYSILSCAQDTDSELSIASQIVNYKRNNPNARITVMGHSLGGGDSVRLLERAGVKIDDLVVWDGRNGSELRCGAGNGPKYRRPKNVTRVTNFYQCGFMPGRRFQAESCVRNVQMSAGHVSLPSRTRSHLNGILNGSRPSTSAECHTEETSTGIAAVDAPIGRGLFRNIFKPRAAAEPTPRNRPRVESSFHSNAKAERMTKVRNPKCSGPGGLCTWAEASCLSYPHARGCGSFSSPGSNR
jgi:hypothetical protein